MKRPHRSIETFDISLMAVVTKAMGAFLVLMLLLIPYYKSGPLGQKPIDDLAKKVEEVNQNIKTVVDKLTTGGAEDLRKLLDEALKELDEARKLIVELKRAVDQLNAQVKRLEEEKAALTAQVQQLQKDKAALTALVAELQNQIEPLKAQIAELQKENDALKAELADLQRQVEQLKAQVAELQNQIEPLKAQIAELQKENDALKAELADLQRQIEPLKAQIAQLQQENAELKKKLEDVKDSFLTGQITNLSCSDGFFTFGVHTADETRTLPDKRDTKYTINGAGVGFEEWEEKSFFDYRPLTAGRYILTVISRSRDNHKKLKTAASDCTISTSIQYSFGSSAGRKDSVDYVISRGNVVVLLGDVVVTNKPDNVEFQPPSPETAAWLTNQIKHAEKEP
jgi:uncharacterized coiled-coil DUF342 family protein